MGRRSCCAKEGLNRGAWTVMEDKILTNYIKAHGEGKWRELPLKTGLKRCRKSCRLRWLNYLRPDIKRGNISTDEEELIVRLHKLLGNRWSLIAGRLPGRTDNEIKNYWNTVISKKKVLRDDKVPLSTKKKNKLDNLKIKVGDNNHRPHQVIRTKAFRCTTAVTILPRQPPLLDADKIINNFDSPEVYVNNNGGNPLKDNYNNNNNGGGDSWVLFGEHDNLLMDSHISDMLLPDNYEMVINNWEKNTASPEVYVNNNGGNPLKDNYNNNNYGGGDSWGLFGEDDNLLMDFDVSDLILPDNYEMVINNWEENTASPQLIGDFDFLSLEKFLGHEEEWKLDDDAS